MQVYKSRKYLQGCPGVPNNKFTLSSRGYPCFFDNTRLDCAWCKNGFSQCGPNKNYGPDSDCGSACTTGTLFELIKRLCQALQKLVCVFLQQRMFRCVTIKRLTASTFPFAIPELCAEIKAKRRAGYRS